jgi:hypothetical protein
MFQKEQQTIKFSKKTKKYSCFARFFIKINIAK